MHQWRCCCVSLHTKFAVFIFIRPFVADMAPYEYDTQRQKDGTVCPYLDTINRKLLDFDLNKQCSVMQAGIPVAQRDWYQTDVVCLATTGVAVQPECVRVPHLWQILSRCLSSSSSGIHASCAQAGARRRPLFFTPWRQTIAFISISAQKR